MTEEKLDHYKVGVSSVPNVVSYRETGNLTNIRGYPWVAPMVQRKRNPTQPTTVQAVEHCLHLIDALSRNERARGVTELSGDLCLAKSTVYRLLRTLVEHGYVLQDPTSGRYRLGLKLLELGAIVSDHLTIRMIAQPHLQALMEATKETVHLGLLEGHEVVYADKIECPQTIRMYSRVGRRSPLHCTALGKALLAYQRDQALRDMVRAGIRRYTSRTITAFRRLRAELQQIRAEGFALDNEEFEDGLRCIAAPIRDRTETVVASLGIAGPATRLESGRMPELIKHVKQAADAVSADLGYKRTGPSRGPRGASLGPEGS